MTKESLNLRDHYHSLLIAISEDYSSTELRQPAIRQEIREQMGLSTDECEILVFAAEQLKRQLARPKQSSL